MKALCVNSERNLELHDIPEPASAPAGHLLIQLGSSAINPGDTFFLSKAAPQMLPPRRHSVWGASAAGRVIGVGQDVPSSYLGRQVALYRSLVNTPEMLGTWSERVIVPPNACARLPEKAHADDYSGSLVNAMTAYAFLDEVKASGHHGVIVTAGNSGTGRAMLALAKTRGVPTLFLTRTDKARDELLQRGAEHVLSSADENFDRDFTKISQTLNTTAVFDGVGGPLVSRLAPAVPLNSTFYFFGFLGGLSPVSISTRLFMSRNLSMKRFSNFESPTVKDPARLASALEDIETLIGDPLFKTKVGQKFAFEDIQQALQYVSIGGARATLDPSMPSS
ncbi:alcohol dehydrogenase catalytic domain-containing protein [Frateuria aurantia]